MHVDLVDCRNANPNSPSSFQWFLCSARVKWMCLLQLLHKNIHSYHFFAESRHVFNAVASDIEYKYLYFNLEFAVQFDGSFILIE